MNIYKTVAILVVIPVVVATLGSTHTALATDCPVDNSPVMILNIALSANTPNPQLGENVEIIVTAENGSSDPISTSFVLDGFKDALHILHIAHDQMPLAGNEIVEIPFNFTLTENGVYDFSAGTYTIEGCNIEYSRDAFRITLGPETCPLCLSINKDPGRIALNVNKAGADRFVLHGSIKPESEIDPDSETMSIKLTNKNGTVYEIEIPAGTLKQNGRFLWTFNDRIAKNNKDGMVSFEVQYDAKDDHYEFRFETFDDLDGATESLMSVKLTVGDDQFFNMSEWEKTKEGWQLSLPGEK